MANEQNLRPGEYKFAREEQKRGGKASGEARRRKKALREIAETLGTAQAPEEIREAFREKGFTKKKSLTLDEALMLAQYAKALTGDTQSAAFIRDTSGQKPAERVSVAGLDEEKSKLDELLNQRRQRHEAESEV